MTQEKHSDKDDRVRKIVDVAASYRPNIMLFNSRDEDLLDRIFQPFTNSEKLKIPEIRLKAIQEIEDHNFSKGIEEISKPTKTPKDRINRDID